MRFGRSKLDWYDYVLLGLALVIVYPDKVVGWWNGCTGRAFRWLHVVVLEVFAVALMCAFMLWLMPIYPKLEWWYPVMGVGVIALFRAVMWGVARAFGF